MRTLLVVALVALCTGTAEAQSPADCYGVFQSTMASGARHPHWDSCAPYLAPVIASYIANEGRRISDPDQLGRIVESVTPYRDPAIFSAALTLAADQSASPRAQLLGWFVAIAEHNPTASLLELGPRPAGWFLKSASGCRWVAPPMDVGRTVDRPLPADYLVELSGLAKSVSANATADPQVRSYAKCVDRFLTPLLPAPQLAASDLRLTLLCGTTFEIANTGELAVDLRWTVEGSQESGELTVPPHSVRRFDAFNVGTVHLFLANSDQQIAEAASGAKTCT